MKGVKREQFRRLVRSIAVMIILVLESFIFIMSGINITAGALD